MYVFIHVITKYYRYDWFNPEYFLTKCTHVCDDDGIFAGCQIPMFVRVTLRLSFFLGDSKVPKLRPFSSLPVRGEVLLLGHKLR